MSTYAWEVTHEWEMDNEWDGNLNRIRGRWVPLERVVRGPHDVSDTDMVTVHESGTPFRMDYDGDGPALKGRMWASDSPTDASESEHAWGPLDDYGTPGYGAVYLLYRINRKWEQL